MLTLSLAVRRTEAKARLLPSAFGQQKAMDSAVAFIVCGTLNPHEALPAALKRTLDAGIIDQAIHDSRSRHVPGQPAFQRDEAIRSGSLAAMTLMLAAKGQGLVSAPMIGFDQLAVAQAFGLSATEVPVMLVTVGYPGSANWPQKPRNAVNNVLQFV
ncbi:nitroreductase family protein [Pseudomonas chlororaphis]|uniref:nitroreductase family protein n=1 Tax=Pseudomonas chlororaphis TaxID=587753 RepID=UPI0024084966|nr:nitroreductase family protein [Pseudomonas chlororaphis]